MVDEVVEAFPAVLQDYKQKTNSIGVPVGDELKYMSASDHNIIAETLKAMSRAWRATAMLAFAPPATTALNKIAFRLTGILTNGIPQGSPTMNTDVAKAWAAAVEALEIGGDTTGTASAASGAFGVGRGILQVTGAFVTGRLYNFASNGSFTTLASGTLLPQAIGLNSNFVYIDMGGRAIFDNSSIQVNASGVVGIKPGANLSLGNVFISNTLTVGGIALFLKTITASTQFRLTESTFATLTGNVSNFLTPETSNLRMSTDAEWNVTGLTNGVNGRVLFITNVGSLNLVFTHQDTNSLAANRIISVTGADLVLQPNEAILLIYDDASARWRGRAWSNVLDGPVDGAIQLGRLKTAGSNPVQTQWYDGLYKIIAIDDVVAVGGGAVSLVDVGFDLPDGSVPEAAWLNIQTALTGAAGATAIGLGIAGDENRYAETSVLTLDGKSTNVILAPPLTSADDLKIFATDGAGLPIGTIQNGSVRVVIRYKVATDLPNA